MKRTKRIGILTGGGDCPGLNAAIRAVAKTAIFRHQSHGSCGMEVIGIEDGYEGLIKKKTRKLETKDVSGILTLGGTILGTSNRANPFAYGEEKKDVSKEVFRNFRNLKLDALVCMGGDGTLHIAHELTQLGMPIVGIPKTIDNDVGATDFTLGFDSAVAVATEAIDNVHSTAESHHRVMIIELMGRYTGWVALYAGVAGGGDIILIPEIPYKIEKICQEVRRRSKFGKRFSIVVMAEGVKFSVIDRSASGGEDRELVVARRVKASTDPIRLGGVSYKIARQIEELTDVETRVIILGHLQRGGKPTNFDRILATQFGKKAVDLVMAEK
ncbi:MAG: 6-phosphofructokinase, partial [candidate division Zixibacteria bacterium]|nr:6-phosphofructokinase [candidate division Zixibacteria bacterium]